MDSRSGDCEHRNLFGPTPAMMEDGDWYQICEDCGQPIHRYLINIQTTVEVKAPSEREALLVADTSAEGHDQRLIDQDMMVVGVDT